MKESKLLDTVSKTTVMTGKPLRFMVFPIIWSMNGAKSKEIQEKKD